ncbi:MAG: ABC transporter transmembrane domain-containing protein [Proteobacteria bacterium]|nr:ABC transporter transmembrane domain-containing protein [Pseudomonadota bacterium]
MSKSKLNSLYSIIPYLKPYKKQIFMVIAALIVTSSIILLLGRVVRYIIDYGFAKGGYHYLNITLVGFIIAILVLAVAGYFRSMLINSVGEKVVADLRNDVYQHIIKVSPEFFEVAKTGDVISRLTVDSSLLYNIISNSISFALRNILLFFGGIILLFLTSVSLTLISFIVIPLAILPVITTGRKIKALSGQSQEKLSIIGSHIEETVNGIKTIQSYLCEDKEIDNFKLYTKDYLDISLQKIKTRAFLISAIIVFAFTSVATVLWFGGNRVLDGQMTSGELSSFIFYAIITAISLVSVGRVMGQLQTAAGASQRLFELLTIESKVTEAAHTQKLTHPKSIKISFNNVNFSYPSRKDKQNITDFNLTIEPRENIAIVGPSGSGKSTIFQLLMRFYDIDSGSIMLNDCDIRDLSLKDLRDSFAYISQDCFIFSDTVYNNIAYADKNISIEEVQKIIDDNEALHFINRLPEGLNSFVGEKGIKLSGGERQRIAVARAIVKDSPVLLLDEATSALDNKNEKLINNSFIKLSKNRTVISIAHRLSTVSNADKIIFVKDGEIVETGTHKSLMKENGFYRKMYETEELNYEI